MKKGSIYTEWSETIGEITATCLYDMEEESYTVSCTMGDTTKEVTWPRMGYEPRFGMDQPDAIRSKMEAEKLAKEIENENHR